MTLNKQNRLAKEKSPYLNQHANNPVDWYPWSEEAFQKAQNENKPILLSIGYTACHWCHVMAHESFEDEETANIMNELFINIKVDREERPDLDKIYQTAHFLLTGQGGGWPLTIFLTPDTHAPFFSGTYFPREARYQMPSFKEILRVISDLYIKKSDLIKQQSSEMKQILSPSLTPPLNVTELSLAPLLTASHKLSQQYDASYGGFGEAPKFPQVSKLIFMLFYDSSIVLSTLKNMAEGGIYDQVGGGFFRYSVDEAWLIPHFEKMLYDNAQLLFLYAVCTKLFPIPLFVTITSQTADWVLHEMQSKHGGFYSSIDADSEGHEGKFYLWDKDEIEKLLDKHEYQAASLYYGLDQLPFIENHWHLSITKPLQFVAEQMQISEKEVTHLLNSARKKIFLVREKRIRPHRDEKILASWNSLMIKGLLAAGAILKKQKYIEAGQQALKFIYKGMWLQHQLFACYKDNESYNDAYLDDYAFLLDAILYSLQIEWNNDFYHWANELAQNLLKHFYDKNQDGFYFTADNHEVLFFRPKVWIDEAVPAGNGIAVQSLLSLGHLSGNMKYINAAEKSLHAVWSNLSAYPQEHATLLLALKEFLTPSLFIVIRGEVDEMKEWSDYCWNYNPFAKVFPIPKNCELPTELAKYKAEKKLIAYACKGTQCHKIHDLKQLEEILSKDQKVPNI